MTQKMEENPVASLDFIPAENIVKTEPVATKKRDHQKFDTSDSLPQSIKERFGVAKK